jgi:2,3-dihydroxyphenylpropionate 1,2-dioxygenase
MTTDRLVVCASHSPGQERDVERAFGRRYRRPADLIARF